MYLYCNFLGDVPASRPVSGPLDTQMWEHRIERIDPADQQLGKFKVGNWDMLQPVFLGSIRPAESKLAK